MNEFFDELIILNIEIDRVIIILELLLLSQNVKIGFKHINYSTINTITFIVLNHIKYRS